jgi:hypothetical protein
MPSRMRRTMLCAVLLAAAVHVSGTATSGGTTTPSSSSSCAAALDKACGDLLLKGPGFTTECDTCVLFNVNALHKAGCNVSDSASFCPNVTKMVKTDKLDYRGRAAPTRRGLRWAVSHPGPAAPFLLGPNTGGWANTTRSVAEATVGILVQPIVFGMNTSGMLTCEFPDLIRTAALKPYADKGLETVVSLFPWIGGLSKGDFAPSGGFMGPSNQGLNCTTSTAKNRTDPRSQYCVTPDRIVRAALARKKDFALELGQLLKQVGASGFSLDWEYFYGNNQTNAAALWSAVKQTWV